MVSSFLCISVISAIFIGSGNSEIDLASLSNSAMNGEILSEVATKNSTGILLKVIGFLVFKRLILSKMSVSLEAVKYASLWHHFFDDTWMVSKCSNNIIYRSFFRIMKEVISREALNII